MNNKIENVIAQEMVVRFVRKAYEIMLQDIMGDHNNSTALYFELFRRDMEKNKLCTHYFNLQ